MIVLHRKDLDSTELFYMERNWRKMKTYGEGFHPCGTYIIIS